MNPKPEAPQCNAFNATNLAIRTLIVPLFLERDLPFVDVVTGVREDEEREEETRGRYVRICIKCGTMFEFVLSVKLCLNF